jgi:hypothetical protein
LIKIENILFSFFYIFIEFGTDSNPERVSALRKLSGGKFLVGSGAAAMLQAVKTRKRLRPFTSSS